MDSNDTEKDDEKKFCCAVKQYYSKDVNLVDTLSISPRVIICKKVLSTSQVYEQTITIKNTGMYPRAISCYTDHPDDTFITIHGLEWYQYIIPTHTVQIVVRVKLLTKRSMNESRHIFIESPHPNVKIEIPIIRFQKKNASYIPDLIEFPRSVPKSFTFYEFILYNSTPDALSFAIRTMNKCLTVQAEKYKINPQDFVRVLAKLSVQDENSIKGQMKLRFGSENIGLAFEHEPKSVSFYMSTRYIRFEEIKFEREMNKQFTICNESLTAISFRFDYEAFCKTGDEVVEEVSSPENSLGNLSSTSVGSLSLADRDVDEDSIFERNYNETKKKEPKHVPNIIAATKSYTITPQQGELPPRSSIKFNLKFQPLFNNVQYSDTQIPPYLMDMKMVFKSTVEGTFEDKCMVIEGLIDGPEMFVTPKAIDFRQVYLGEEHCEQIRITNIDATVKSYVKFYDYSNPDSAKAFLTPFETLELNPCETAVFTLTFFSLVVGKIYLKLRFKIQNGPYLYVVVRAISVPVRVKTFPEIIEFGSVPFAVPQKRTVLLMNPLSVPITMECFMEDNGSEVPLVLNVDDVNGLPPVNIQNPILQIIARQEEDKVSAYHSCEELMEHSSEIFHSHSSDCDNLTECSNSFRAEVLNVIPKLSNDVVAAIKFNRYTEKVDPEVKIIAKATDELLKIPYFEILKKYNNYACMDWDGIPSDPIETYFDSEIISLRPNASRCLTVLIIPNNVGYFNRAINIRCCPHSPTSFENEQGEVEQNPFEMIVDSELMVTKLWLEYNCRIPEISWNNEINLEDRKIYSLQRFIFDMEFTNTSNIGGFIHYVVVPCSKNGVMHFLDSTWKFYIPAEERQVVKCGVEFGVSGKITLSGMVKIVGSSMGMPFHIKANVLPTQISISPNRIRIRQNVLEKSTVIIYITNVTPTVTGLFYHLRNESHQTIDTYGAQLGPFGQGTYIILTTTFSDPEVSVNTLYIDLIHGIVLEIPIVNVIEGMPIFFDPDITKDYDIGTALLSSELDYEARNLNVSKKIRVWNMGERTYTINFSKMKASMEGSSSCQTNTVKAQIYFAQKSIVLAPGEEKYISIVAVACEKVYVRTDFRCIIVDQTNPKRFWSKSFTISATFSEAEVVWSRKEIIFSYNRTHKYKQRQQLELVELVNTISSRIENMHLRVCGPFKIKMIYERPFTKEIELELESDERKLISIELDKTKMSNATTAFLKGKIYCTANEKAQKSLPLRVDICYPDVVIVHSDIVLFTTREESDTEVILENLGLLDAEYKWKKICECQKYVAVTEDYKGLASDILSDILRMLDLHDKDIRDNDSICQKNMTLCYQKYRCELAELDDPDGIGDIINEIIDNLDLEHKRYELNLMDVNELQDLWDVTKVSSQEFVKQTFEEVLDKLKLEDSYTISEPSVEECFKKDHFYFFEKTGVVLSKHGAYSLLHLPGVRKGHAHMACFLLDVVGGGQPHKFVITLVNLEKIVDILPDSIYLGVRPWYEFFKAYFKIYNTTQFQVKAQISDMPGIKYANRRNYDLINGYACISKSRFFDLSGFGSYRIKTEGIMGFSSEFVRDFEVTINDRIKSKFRLRGQGVMPMLLAVRTDLPRTKQHPSQILEEYQQLQRIYYFQMFHDITYVDEELEAPLGEEEQGAVVLDKELSLSQISILSIAESNMEEDSSLDDRIAHNWERLLSTYVVVYNNTSLPHASMLEQLIYMERFIHDLYKNDYKKDILQQIYRKHREQLCKFDPKIATNLKYFTVQALPFDQWGYILDMRGLKLGQFRRYTIDLQFFGPGKLTASARTVLKIPGLYVHFDVGSKRQDEFMFYRSAEKMPDFYVKRYRNMFEREIDTETDQKLLHAHSFDCEERCKFHKRDIASITAKDRKDINNYYSSLNKSVYLKNKHHIINSTIYSKRHETSTGTILRVNILFRLDKKYFSEGQVIEDYLYIDLHMGPTIPILLRGLVK